MAFELGCGFSTELHEIPNDTDIVIIAVNDDAIATVADGVRCKRAVVAHTSGSVPIEVLSNCSDRIGVFYPLQTMHRDADVNMAEVPFCIEGNSKWNEGVLLELARSISENVQVLNSEQRKVAHIAAVFACNFTNHFYALAEQILQEKDMDLSILKPLIAKTARNIYSERPKELQTGPAKRNDTEVMQDHMKLLGQLSPELGDLYAEVSESIMKMHT